MARRFAAALVAALMTCCVLGAGSVGAATEFGSGCDPDTGIGLNGMALQMSRATPPVALKSETPGVVTSWRVQSAAWLETRTMALKVFRQIGGEYEVVAESTPGIVPNQPDNQFATRIPVGAGVIFGVKSSTSFPGCESGSVSGDVVALLGPDVPVGGKAKVGTAETTRRLTLTVVVEPDADGDGYGDETQDKCPQSAATQGACPAPPGGGGGGATVKVKGKPKLEGNVVAVKLTTSAATKVTVTGSIRGKRAAAPASKTVRPGETGRLYLQLSKGTKQRLANLPRKRKLKMVIEAKVAGSPTVSTELSLPGRKKPQRPPAPRAWRSLAGPIDG